MAVKKRTWTNKDGTTSTAYQVGYSDAQGKWRTKSYDKKKEAELFFEKVRQEVRAGSHVADTDSCTVEEAGKIWLDDLAGSRDRSTVRQYSNHLRNHIYPIVGKVLLTKLSKARVADLRSKLIATNSLTQARKVYTTFKALLKEAQATGLLGHDPSLGIEIKTDVR